MPGVPGTFKEVVLELKPHTGARQLADKVEDALIEGRSLEACERGLTDRGLSHAQARELVDRLAGSGVWSCSGCGEHYVRKVRTCKSCDRR